MNIQNSELKIGDHIKDNDPRATYNRLLVVVDILPERVIAEDSGGRRFLILRRRIFTDGKSRRSGFTKV